MTDDLPPETASNAPHPWPEPTSRRRYSFRIRGLMVVIMVIAVLLGLFRASPLLAVLAVPTLPWYRWFVKDSGREAGEPVSVRTRIMLLVPAILAGLTTGSVVILFLYTVLVIIALGLGLVR